MEQDLPIRCRAEEVADQLRLVVAGLPFLADRAWDEVGCGLMRIELLTLWRIALLLKPKGSDGGLDMGLAWVDRADAPDGRCWEYGCQRDDWTLGPDSRLVDPLEFLSGEERIELESLLREARCWPEPIISNEPTTALVLEDRIRSRRPTRRPAQRPVRR
ncbi:MULTISPECIES: hypothetical protein [unclassified Cyanobium]|uniref:DUF7693 family protein n=1 Tax=unclassified Cyanobium TaxID=2627006 RepID=UPI0020CC4409|nr:MULTISPECIES: hypothetical protein [unclassified Cyanobium]MCP9860951.1 hypothetical protein [Cyanobium sp. Cruz-8H5]MCP9868220.1 hypothetical protein [Cyanobium sp. Cruz-8D1]